MSNLYFLVAGLFCAILICFLFFSKERLEGIETKIYGTMIVSSLIDVMLVLVVVFIAYVNYNPVTYNLICILDKIDFIHYILWPSLLFIYVYYITYCDTKYFKKKFNNVTRISMIVNLIAIIIQFFLPISLYNVDGAMAVLGMGVNFVYMIAIIYLLLIFLVLIFNVKKIFRKKYMPVWILIFFMAIAIIVRAVNPTLIIIPAIIVYINLIMYFTIENPDLKLMRELDLARNNAERANNAKTEFLSSMSHEIRTPLNAIVGFSNSILEDKTLEEAKEEAKDIIMASNNLLEIVNGILDISKIEAGKMEIVNVNYSPKRLFDDILKLVKPRLSEKDVELRVNISSDIPGILFGDMTKIREIVSNLLTNACKYTEKGYIEFNVSCINSDDISKLVISVEDTGRGIESNKIDKLFMKFNRLDEDKNTTLEGTGLGLAITKSLVDMMAGKIIVQSKYEEGSKFIVYLSQKIVSMDEDIEIEEIEIVKEEIDYSKKKVLVVDDNKLNLKVATRLLKNYNVGIDTCVSGFECLEMVKTNKYDLIFLDDMMPKMSGVETFKKLKEDKEFKVPVVILTANAISGMRDKYLKEGLDEYLAKPIDKLELERILRLFFKD